MTGDSPIFDELTFERLVSQLATVDSLADLGWVSEQ